MATMRTAIGVFDDPHCSLQALDELHRTGFLEDQIRVVQRNGSRMVGQGELLGSLGLAADEAPFYEGQWRAGRTLVAVSGPDCYHEALAILRRNGALSM